MSKIKAAVDEWQGSWKDLLSQTTNQRELTGTIQAWFQPLLKKSAAEPEKAKVPAAPVRARLRKLPRQPEGRISRRTTAPPGLPDGSRLFEDRTRGSARRYGRSRDHRGRIPTASDKRSLSRCVHAYWPAARSRRRMSGHRSLFRKPMPHRLPARRPSPISAGMISSARRSFGR